MILSGSGSDMPVKVPNPQHKTAPGGSTGTDINGHAVRLACEKLRQRLDAVRSRFPALKSWEEVVLQVGLRFRIHFIRIQYGSGSNPDPGL
jgi:xanthine dehydrogenase molybdopterin-binding subunit B